MKNTLIASAIAILAASTAFAGDFSYGGYGEYAIEAQTVELGVTAGYAFDNGISTFATFVGTDAGYNDFQFDHTEVEVTYGLSTNADLYTKVTLDSSFNYDEAVVGVALKF